jgi:CheY-like chemotaxis protein
LAPKVEPRPFCYIFVCRNRGFLIVIPPSSPRRRPSGAALAIYVVRTGYRLHNERFSSSTDVALLRRQSIANTMASDILIVDDEADIREMVAGILQDEGHGTRTARDSDEALSAVVARRPDLVFLDIWLKGSRLDGFQLLDRLKKQHPDLPIVMISGHGNAETAASATKRGAYDLIGKPFKADRLMLVAQRALENSPLQTCGE